MDELEDAPPAKEFGPSSSSRKRRLWGIVCVLLVIGFLYAATTLSGESNIQQGGMSFGRDTAETPPIWALALGIFVVLAVSIGAPVLANKLPKIEDKSDD